MSSFPIGHLAEHPLPPGILGSLGIHGYQLLSDVAGVGAGRLGSHAFLLLAPDPDPALPDAGTQIALHHDRLRDDIEMQAFIQLAAQLGYMRLSGYRLAPERNGLRSRIHVINPATGGEVTVIPDRHPGKLFGRGTNAASILAAVRALPPAGPPPDLGNPELLRGALLALALRDDTVSGADAPELAERALSLLKENPSLDPPAALEAAKAS